MIIVFSKSLRKIRISTSEIAQKYLSDSDCQTTIESIMIQSFKMVNIF
ncbi:MAG: TPM domain-containing protein [Bacteroidales bacterium]|nr:TPM domain-containing protein [Bacteroidales bacterium]